MSERSFMERAVAGEFEDLQDALLNATDEWHDSESELSLHEFLGMTYEEYGAVMFEAMGALEALVLWKRACQQL